MKVVLFWGENEAKFFEKSLCFVKVPRFVPCFFIFLLGAGDTTNVGLAGRRGGATGGVGFLRVLIGPIRL